MSRFSTGIVFVFRRAGDFPAGLGLTKAAAPHNPKQSKTIVIFAVQVIQPIPSPLSRKPLLIGAGK
jgi:hypothetical protein